MICWLNMFKWIKHLQHSVQQSWNILSGVLKHLYNAEPTSAKAPYQSQFDIQSKSSHAFSSLKMKDVCSSGNFIVLFIYLRQGWNLPKSSLTLGHHLKRAYFLSGLVGLQLSLNCWPCCNDSQWEYSEKYSWELRWFYREKAFCTMCLI